MLRNSTKRENLRSRLSRSAARSSRGRPWLKLKRENDDGKNEEKNEKNNEEEDDDDEDDNDDDDDQTK